MGACFNFSEGHKIGATDWRAVTARGEEIIDQAAYDYGHAGYTGSFAECDGVRIDHHEPFSDANAAEEWLSDNAEKWGPMVAVRYRDANGDILWAFGAWCSS